MASRPRILVVDDEVEIVRSIQRMLRLALRAAPAHDVVVTTSPGEALELADRAVAEGAPLLVISDFNMGSHLDGLQFLEEVGRVNPKARLVLISGYPKEDFAARPEFAQIHEFVAKPFDVAQISGLVTPFLAGAST